uniref:Uncharacterized protein n=1 Tax=Tetradesmus obliquus TaxID=3088 RepID=A0A383W1H4_TETOB|eukprot:jgi/Sobl393_1/7014/SZX70516.1
MVECSAPSRGAASLFRPLRKYQGIAAANGRVCTLESVAGVLLQPAQLAAPVALEGDAAVHEGLLHVLKLEVDAMSRQKHMDEVYGTSAGDQRGASAKTGTAKTTPAPQAKAAPMTMSKPADPKKATMAGPKMATAPMPKAMPAGRRLLK